MIITAEQSRELFGEYRDFVFILTQDDVDYICKYSPDGWEEQNIQYLRSRTKFGLFRSFTTDLKFIREDADYLLNIVDTYKFEGNVYITIQELDVITANYIIIYEGKLDFSNATYNDYRYKVTVTDSDLNNYIEKNGDIEYNMTISDLVSSHLTPGFIAYYQQFDYEGISLRDIGISNATGSQSVEEAVLTYIYLINPSQNFANLDSENSIFQNTVNAFRIPYNGGTWQPYEQHFIKADSNGGLCTVQIDNFQINFDWLLSEGINSYCIALVTENHESDLMYVQGNSWVINTNYVGVLQYDLNLQDNKPSGYQIQNITKNMTLEANEGLQLRVILNRKQNQDYVLKPFNYNTISNLTVSYRGIVTQKSIDICPLSELTKAVLYKLTDNNYYKVNGLDNYNNLVAVNGNMLRGFKIKIGDITVDEPGTYSFKIKFNDILNFWTKAIGLAFDIVDNELCFTKITDKFDLTSSVVDLGEVTELSINSFTDYHFSTIKTGYSDYASEYLSGKYDMFAKATFKSPVNSTKNELDICPTLSANAFEIEEQVRRGTINTDLHDYTEDTTVYIIWCKYNSSYPHYEMFKDNYDLDNSQLFPYNETIFNLKLTPVRNLLRSSFFLRQLMISEESYFDITSKTKNEMYFSKFTDEESIIYEGRRFYVYPYINNNIHGFINYSLEEQKIEEYQYIFSAPISPTKWNLLINNLSKVVLFSFNGKKYAGFLDDFSKNPLTNDTKNIKLIKAHLTTEQIELL